VGLDQSRGGLPRFHVASLPAAKVIFSLMNSTTGAAHFYEGIILHEFWETVPEKCGTSLVPVDSFQSQSLRIWHCLLCVGDDRPS